MSYALKLPHAINLYRYTVNDGLVKLEFINPALDVVLVTDFPDHTLD